MALGESASGSVKYYEVKSGRVDPGTYRGWRLFHSNCYGCHGVDGTGTDVAPNLVERVKALSASDFTVKVLTRYRIVVPASEASGDDQTATRQAIVEEVLKQERGKRGEILMPAWESNSRVKPHLLDLYGYLKARADGVLGPGRPKLAKRQNK